MNTKNIIKTFSFIFILIGISLASSAQQKKKRVFTQKETTDSFIKEKFSLLPVTSFILKFSEGTKIRKRGNSFLIPGFSISNKNLGLLKDNNISVNDLRKELLQLNAIFRGFQNMTVKRYFERPEQEIDNEQDSLEKIINEELADLNLYYLVVLKSGDAKELIAALNHFKIVENAYPVNKSENAFSKTGSGPLHKTVPDTTVEFSEYQNYLDAAPLGINARYAWTINGGKGWDIKIIDVEALWDLDHEDIKKPFWISSREVKSYGNEDGDHGTSVLGQLIAVHNKFGVKGICPDAGFGVSGVSPLGNYETAVGAAIDNATSNNKLRKGDIILIEQHLPWPATDTIDPNCNPSQFGFIPMEYAQECFDAIRRATSKGIIVVEAAGNGGMDLDAPGYGSLFDRNVRDSKAIIVAADSGGNGIPVCYTNYGSRIDFYAWGEWIVTTGGGDYPDSAIDVHKKYTDRFGGTSGASPIVVGAIACIQGIRKKRGLKVWTVEEIRKNMIGTPQVPGTKFIGKMPDLKATIEKMKLP